MYQVDDVIVYGKHGVCRVKEIGTLSMSQADNEKLYYTLSPMFRSEVVLYAPVDNTKVVMRSVLSKKQVEELIGDMPQIPPVEVENEKERETAYKRALLSADQSRVVSLLKTISQRQRQRTAEGKKLTMLDEKYFRMAETFLLDELAYGLGKDPKEIDEFVQEKLVVNE